MLVEKYQNFRSISKKPVCSLYFANQKATGIKVIIKKVKTHLSWNEFFNSAWFKLEKSTFFPRMLQVFRSERELFIVYQKPRGFFLTSSENAYSNLDEINLIMADLCSFFLQTQKDWEHCKVEAEWVIIGNKSIKICHFETSKKSLNEDNQINSEHVFLFQKEHRLKEGNFSTKKGKQSKQKIDQQKHLTEQTKQTGSKKEKHLTEESKEVEIKKDDIITSIGLILYQLLKRLVYNEDRSENRYDRNSGSTGNKKKFCTEEFRNLMKKLKDNQLRLLLFSIFQVGEQKNICNKSEQPNTPLFQGQFLKIKKLKKFFQGKTKKSPTHNKPIPRVVEVGLEKLILSKNPSLKIPINQTQSKRLNSKEQKFFSSKSLLQLKKGEQNTASSRFFILEARNNFLSSEQQNEKRLFFPFSQRTVNRRVNASCILPKLRASLPHKNIHQKTKFDKDEGL